MQSHLLTWRHFAVIGAVVFVVVPFVAFVGGGGRALHRHYLRALFGPHLRSRYGFSTGPVTVQTSDGPFTDDAITAVVPGGLCAEAGLRRGDTVWLWGGEIGDGVDVLYSELRELDEAPEVSFLVRNLYELETEQSTRRVTVRKANAPHGAHGR